MVDEEQDVILGLSSSPQTKIGDGMSAVSTGECKRWEIFFYHQFGRMGEKHHWRSDSVMVQEAIWVNRKDSYLRKKAMFPLRRAKTRLIPKYKVKRTIGG